MPVETGCFVDDFHPGMLSLLIGINCSSNAKNLPSVYQDPSFYPPHSTEYSPFGAIDAEICIKKLSMLGYNSIRWLVTWEDIEPNRHRYNNAYLEDLARHIEIAAKYDIISFVDVHCDLYSRRLGGCGFPDHALPDEYQSMVQHGRLKADVRCLPASVSLQNLMPTHKIPKYSTHMWPMSADSFSRRFVDSKHQKRIWRYFFDNRWCIQERFSEFFSYMVDTLMCRKPRGLVGFEVLNEPLFDDMYHFRFVFSNNSLISHKLSAFYQTVLCDVMSLQGERLHSEKWKKRPLFLIEPFPTDSYLCSPVGIDPQPLRSALLAFPHLCDQLVYAFHFYKPVSIIAPSVYDVITHHAETARRAGISLPIVCTEFGDIHYGTSSRKLNSIRRQCRAFRKAGVGAFVYECSPASRMMPSRQWNEEQMSVFDSGLNPSTLQVEILSHFFSIHNFSYQRTVLLQLEASETMYGAPNAQTHVFNEKVKELLNVLIKRVDDVVPEIHVGTMLITRSRSIVGIREWCNGIAVPNCYRGPRLPSIFMFVQVDTLIVGEFLALVADRLKSLCSSCGRLAVYTSDPFVFHRYAPNDVHKLFMSVLDLDAWGSVTPGGMFVLPKLTAKFDSRLLSLRYTNHVSPQTSRYFLQLSSTKRSLLKAVRSKLERAIKPEFNFWTIRNDV
ncbi:hypothetical protein PCE1_002884 [Barthelona sp. PCE]